MPSRYKMATGQSVPKKDALTQAIDMLKRPMTEVPQKARDYAGFLCAKYGGCMEVLVTAYAHFAQAENAAPCSDDAYQIQDEGKDWFRQHSPGSYPMAGWDGAWTTSQKSLYERSTEPKWARAMRKVLEKDMEENKPYEEEP